MITTYHIFTMMHTLAKQLCCQLFLRIHVQPQKFIIYHICKDTCLWMYLFFSICFVFSS